MSSATTILGAADLDEASTPAFSQKQNGAAEAAPSEVLPKKVQCDAARATGVPVARETAAARLDAERARALSTWRSTSFSSR